jgi:hypothetical protein
MRQTESNQAKTDEPDSTDDNPLGGLSDELRDEQAPPGGPAATDRESTTLNDAKEKREQDQSHDEDGEQDGPRSKRVREELGARLTVNLYTPIGVRASSMFKHASAIVELQLGEENVIEKNRHWYPLIFELGLDAIEDMDDEELTAALLAYDDDRSLEK